MCMKPNTGITRIFLAKCFLLATALLLSGHFATAQNILRLPDAVNIALKNSLDLQLAKNKVEAGTINNNIGVAGGLPLVTGNLSDNEQVSNINQQLNTGTSITRSGASTNTLNAGVTGSILLYNGGRVIATKKRLAELELQSKDLLNSRIQQVMADVMTAYYDIVHQQGYIPVLQRSIDAAKQKLEIVRVRQSAGMANDADLFQAQVDLNDANQAMQAQLLLVNQAKTEILRLLTLKADSAVSISDTITVDRSVDLNAVLANLARNPDVLAADEQIKINALIIKETIALRYPTVRANSGFSFARSKAAAGQILLNQNYGPSVGVTVGIPIYNGSIYKRQQRTATLDLQNAQLQKQVLLRDYSAQVVKLYEAYSDALKQLQTEQENYRLSGQLLNLVLQRFQLRQATIIDVKNAQQSYENAGFRLVGFNYAAKSSEIELKKLASLLSL